MKVFAPAEVFAKQLQAKNVTAQEVISGVLTLERFYKEMRTSDSFSRLFKEVVDRSKTLDIGTPEQSMPRKRKRPRHLLDYVEVDGVASSTTNDCSSAEQFYRMQFFEIIDILLTGLKNRFDQPTLDYLKSLENLLIGAVSDGGVQFSAEELGHRFTVLKRDINFQELSHELAILPSCFREHCPEVKTVTSVQTVCEFMNKANMKKSFSQFHLVLRLYLTVPLSNATSERGFSTLRRVKSCLRSCLTQRSLNHYLVLHGHKDKLDLVDLERLASEFINAVPDKRRPYFGAF